MSETRQESLTSTIARSPSPALWVLLPQEGMDKSFPVLCVRHQQLAPKNWAPPALLISFCKKCLTPAVSCWPSPRHEQEGALPRTLQNSLCQWHSEHRAPSWKVLSSLWSPLGHWQTKGEGWGERISLTKLWPFIWPVPYWTARECHYFDCLHVTCLIFFFCFVLLHFNFCLVSLFLGYF